MSGWTVPIFLNGTLSRISRIQTHLINFITIPVVKSKLVNRKKPFLKFLNLESISLGLLELEEKGIIKIARARKDRLIPLDFSDRTANKNKQVNK